MLDQLALADGLLASALALPAVPSTHHAPWAWCSTGGAALGPCSRPAHLPAVLAGLNHCADPHRFCCWGLGPEGLCAFLAPAKPRAVPRAGGGALITP